MNEGRVPLALMGKPTPTETRHKGLKKAFPLQLLNPSLKPADERVVAF
jgi:hypothetical protein